MSQTVTLMVLLGALVGAGILLLVWSLTPHEPSRVATQSALLRRVRSFGARLPIAFGVALVLLVLTRWPVLAAAGAALVLLAPFLMGGAGSEKAAIARLDGLAAWTESLRDTIAGAVGLEQAIPATAYAASPAISPQLIDLSDRLRMRTPLPTALQRFADDLDDSSADMVIAALILNSRLRGPGLREVLTSLAESARAELEMRRRVVAGRASTRRSVQIVVGITVLFVVGLAVFNREYVAPYASPVGQLVLLIVLAFFALGFLWMRRLAVFEIPDRFLLSATPPGDRR
ncbi:type II secretion system F family protein [Mumia zhuanghuii]|uniref:Type II secretion system protein n=1 Tax=Mumia zhuanghuii TaxID=2585211 RepID=A0A5C4ME51_9ACTN|nr:type II secretion system F family protein [Mumia zhuanghuii]TNC40001.1 type II secretion system protein [Mumia zhuanghuii]TNC40371.1 type II secretion system protein [Mumia zhuanghuii]